MEIVICKTKEEASKLAADMITAAVKKNPKTVLGLATGSTPVAMYTEMAQAVKEDRDIHIVKNDGTQFIHASQQAQLYMKVLESDKNEEIFLGLGSVWISWREIAEMMLSLRPETKSKIVEQDLGWGDEPMLFDVQKIKDQFGLVFDGHDFMMDHVKWTFSQV